MQDIRDGKTCWIDSADHFQAMSPLHSDVRCDVAVIGAGVSGAFIAQRLVERGFDVVVVDRGQPGSGSSAACTALVQYDLDQPLIELIGQYGVERASETYRSCVWALERLQEVSAKVDPECKLIKRPSLLLARKSSHLREMKKELEARKAAGIDVAWVEKDELMSEWNVDRPGAIASSLSFELDPYRLTRLLLINAASAGARVFTPVEVVWEDLPYKADENDKIRLETTHGPTITASHVVVATGYQTPEYVRRYFGDLASTFAACSAPVDNLDEVWSKRQLIWEWGTAYLYARTLPDNRVIFGGGDLGFKDAHQRNALTHKTIDSLAKQLEKCVPGLKIEPVLRWSGTFGETSDGMPYIGAFPDNPRLHFALGFGGNGLTFSVLAAQIISEEIEQSTPRSPLANLFSFDR